MMEPMRSSRLSPVAFRRRSSFGNVRCGCYVPEELLEIVDPRELDQDWQSKPEVLRDFGATWARSQRSLGLRVPSAVIPAEDNVMLNPLHADFSRVSIRVATIFARPAAAAVADVGTGPSAVRSAKNGRSKPVVFVAVFVAVVVVAPGAVAALGSGNDRVGVIKPVSEDATCAQCDR
jgi:hypothetical protein